MSLSSSRVGYRHRVTIERDAKLGSKDADWGGQQTPEWKTHLASLRCRAWTNGAMEPVNDQATVTYEDRRVSVPVGTDVTERDRVADVKDAQGNVIFEGPSNIEGVLRYSDHVELMLERIR